MTSNLTKRSKSLLIFDLNGVLGHLTKDFGKVGSSGIYSRGELEAKPAYTDNNLAIF